MQPMMKPPLFGQKILLVDDDRIHRELASAVLRKLGCEVVQARDGQEALARLRQDDYYLILMDIQMPWMDGISAAEHMRNLKHKGDMPDIPIVALTSDHSDETAQRCFEAGMEEVIPKHIWKPKWEHVIVQKLSRWM